MYVFMQLSIRSVMKYIHMSYLTADLNHTTTCTQFRVHTCPEINAQVWNSTVPTGCCQCRGVFLQNRSCVQLHSATELSATRIKNTYLFENKLFNDCGLGNRVQVNLSNTRLIISLFLLMASGTILYFTLLIYFNCFI